MLKNDLVKKYLSFSYGSFAALFVSIGATMISTRVLSPKEFGEATLFLTILHLFHFIMMFGSDVAFVRFFYEEKEELRGKLLYNCIKLSLLSLGFLSIASFVLYDNIFILREVNNISSIFILLLGTLAQTIFRYVVLVIRMRQKGNIYSLLEIAGRVLPCMLMFLFYLFIGGKAGIIIYSAISSCAILSIFMMVLESDFWHIKNIYSDMGVKHSLKEIYQYSWPYFLAGVMIISFQTVDKFLLKYFCGAEELGLYSGAFKLISLLNIIQATFTTFWAPVALNRYQKSPEDRMFFVNVLKVVSFVMFSFGIVVIAAKDVFIKFLGAEFVASARIMSLMVFMPLMWALSEITGSGISFLKKPKINLVVTGVSCFMSVIINIIFIRLFGALGASIALALSYIILFSMRTFVSWRLYKVAFPLKRIYTFVFLIFLYALYVSFSSTQLINTACAVILLSLNVAWYYKDIQSLYRLLQKLR